MEHIQKIVAIAKLAIETANTVSSQSKKYRRFKNAYRKRDRSKKRLIHGKWRVELIKLQLIPLMAATQMHMIISQPIKRNFVKGGI